MASSNKTSLDKLKNASREEIAALSPKNQLKAFLVQNESTLMSVLPKHVTPERMMQVALTAFTTTPELRECSVPTVLSAVVQSATMGLEPNTVMGQAYLVPFKNRKQNRKDCQLIIGYRGLIDLARRSGEIVSLSAHEVYDGDHFSFSYGLNEHLDHIPGDDTEDNPITHAYAIAHLKGGGHVFEVMTKRQIDKIRSSSQTGGSQYSPWSTHYAAMARKTVIRRLAKYLPMSVELATAVDTDERADRGEQHNIFEGEATLIDEPPQQPKEDTPPPKKKTVKRAKKADPEPEPEDDNTGIYDALDEDPGGNSAPETDDPETDDNLGNDDALDDDGFLME